MTMQDSISTDIHGKVAAKGNDSFMIAADLLQDIDFPFAKNFFSGTGIELGNGHAHSPFNTPVRIDKLPAEALGQLAANMTFAAPHHADENDIPLHHYRRTSSISILCICTPLFYHNFFSLTQKILYFFFIEL